MPGRNICVATPERKPPHAGLRADGRFIAVKNKDAAPFFGENDNRYGARIYGGLLLNF